MHRQLYVACFPQLPTEGRWVQDLRKLYDPKVDLVSPHITLVFPTAAFPLDEMTKEIQKSLADFPSFSAVFGKAIATTENNSSSVFLLPDEGIHMGLWQKS